MPRDSNFLLVFLFLVILFSCKKENDLIPSPGEIKVVPTLAAVDTSNLSLFSIDVSSKLIDEGSAVVTEQGFLLGLVDSTNIENANRKFPLAKDHSNMFSMNMLSFSFNTTYFMRSYAKSAHGIGYGKEIKFTSPVEKRYSGLMVLDNQQKVIDFAQSGYNSVGWLTISGSVTDLSPLKNLVIVNYLEIKYTTQLTTLSGLNNLEYSSEILLQGNTALQNLDAFRKIRIINGDLNILENNSLTDLNGFNKLQVLGGLGNLLVRNCPNIRSLSGLENLEHVGNNVNILGNNNLENVSALSKLERVFGDLNILDNRSLLNLNGFEKMGLVGSVTIQNNNLLNNIDALNNIDSLEMAYGGNIYIIQNPALGAISAFNKISTFQDVLVRNNSNLTSLNLFGISKKIERLIIEDNPTLSNLRGLEKIRSAVSITITNTGLSNFCTFKPLFESGYNNPFTVTGNILNPTINEVLTNCP